MMSRKYTLAIAAVLVSAVSCDYLDKRENTDGLSLEQVFGDAYNYERYVDWMVQNPMIKYQQAGADPHGTWDDISDNSMCTMQFTVPCLLSADGAYLTMITNGRSVMCNQDVWTRMWKVVRIANMGLKYIDMYPGDEAGRNKILGTCYFYRAYAYFEICRRWGGMPYMFEPVEDFSQDLDFEREDMRTTYLYIAEDFEKAAQYLEPVIDDSEWQHPTAVAAMALRSRAMLYAASPQATTEGGEVRENLWAEAVKAADDAIRLAEDNGYQLAPGENYYDIFKGTNSDIYTKEVLFGRRAKIAWGSEAYKVTIRPPGKLTGTYGPAANQKLVDCFDLTNGYPITDPKSGYNPQDPYKNRGLRFDHDILYNQAVAFGNKKMDLYNQVEGAAAMGGGDISYNGGSVAAGFTRTGTYAIKWMGKEWQKELNQVWPYIRIAELYLNYAEAAAETGQDINSNAGFRYTPLEALNKIRNRAGIADLPVEYQTPERFKERVQNERRVELCFEDHRFYDIRRLLIGKTYDNDIYRVNIVKLKKGYDPAVYPTGYRYEEVKEPVLVRVYEDKHNLFPILQDDTYIGPKFKQNPGW
ncbi:MAG: RagB/SusD family nutrient uptake outer membrane protein [Candidatus Cryptobacteroides sp.]